MKNMNKYQRKNSKKTEYLKGELRRYIHRCEVLEQELERAKKEIKLHQGVIDASEAYLVYVMTKCKVNAVDLNMEEAVKVLDKVKVGEVCIVIDAKKQCIRIADTIVTEK